MNNIEFNPHDTEFKNTGVETAEPRSKMVGWLTKYSRGLIKDETHANYVLLALAGIFFILTIAVIMSTFDIGPKKTTYKEDIPPEIRAAMPPEVYDSLPSRNN